MRRLITTNLGKLEICKSVPLYVNSDKKNRDQDARIPDRPRTTSISTVDIIRSSSEVGFGDGTKPINFTIGPDAAYIKALLLYLSLLSSIHSLANSLTLAYFLSLVLNKMKFLTPFPTFFATATLFCGVFTLPAPVPGPKNVSRLVWTGDSLAPPSPRLPPLPKFKHDGEEYKSAPSSTEYLANDMLPLKDPKDCIG